MLGLLGWVARDRAFFVYAQGAAGGREAGTHGWIRLPGNEYEGGPGKGKEEEVRQGVH